MSDATVQTFRTRSGPMLALKGDFYITRSLEVYGEYCPDEWRVLRQIILPGMTVVEVGANMGAHSVDMARACAPGPFYAFEPQPRVFQVLCANLAFNDIQNAFAYPEGCGGAEEQAVVPLIDYSGRDNFAGLSLMPADQAGIKVRVRPLDSLGLATCGLLKVDVEGFEPFVLRGARRDGRDAASFLSSAVGPQARLSRRLSRPDPGPAEHGTDDRQGAAANVSVGEEPAIYLAGLLARMGLLTPS